MPTKPLESILYRELSKVEAKEIIDYATNVLARCAASNSRKPDEDLAILALYRHVIEQTDGIEVLLSQGCAPAAIPLLRSSFEAVMSMEYILESESNYSIRSLSWLVAYIHNRNGMYQLLDIRTAKGLQFKKDIEDDKIGEYLRSAPEKEARQAAANLSSVLTKPHMVLIEQEYSRIKNPQWYQLFGGPPNAEALARHLKRGAQYAWLYRHWSTIVHAQDFSSLLTRTKAGRSVIKRLRDTGDIKLTATLGATFCMDATRMAMGKYRTEELGDFAKWYKNEARTSYLLLAGTAK
jgi:hypothetical protein